MRKIDRGCSVRRFLVVTFAWVWAVIILSWDASTTAAVEYRIYRATGQGFQLLGQVPGLTFSDDSSPDGETVQYFVTAVLPAAGLESQSSNAVTIVNPPASPGSLTAQSQ